MQFVSYCFILLSKLLTFIIREFRNTELSENLLRNTVEFESTFQILYCLKKCLWKLDFFNLCYASHLWEKALTKHSQIMQVYIHIEYFSRLKDSLVDSKLKKKIDELSETVISSNWKQSHGDFKMRYHLATFVVT